MKRLTKTKVKWNKDINNYFPQNAYKGKYIEDIANKLKKDINLNWSLYTDILD